MPLTTRRRLLSATALVAFSSSALARSVTGRLPWSPNEAYPPEVVRPGGWLFLRPEEVATLDAIASRLIPADDLSPSGKDAGCTVFIDRQLAGPWGSYDWYYMQGPFAEKPLPQHVFQALERQIGVHGAGAVPHQERDMVHFARIPRLDDERAARSSALSNQMVVDARRGQQARNRCELLAHTAIRHGK